uniref:Putative ovule protein n=1 Tax=Solanum chacoense TaxID=4108 RepID=A0A0V0GIL7_SOLCH
MPLARHHHHPPPPPPHRHLRHHLHQQRLRSVEDRSLHHLPHRQDHHRCRRRPDLLGKPFEKLEDVGRVMVVGVAIRVRG